MDWSDEEDDLALLEAVDALEQQALSARAGQAQEPTAGGVAGPTASEASKPAAAPGAPAPQAPPPPRQPEQPLRTPADLWRRCQQLRSAAAPPPLPSHDRCPGVYGRGCGGALQLVRMGEGSFFWACSNYPDCAYREFPPPRKLTPEMCILLDCKHGTVDVAAMPGAEEAVAHCGGVPAVLRVAGVDLRRALPPPAACLPHTDAVQRASATQLGCGSGTGTAGQSKLAGGSEGRVPAPSTSMAGAQQPPPLLAPAHAPQAVTFPLHEYERVSNQLVQFSRQHNICLLSNAGMIPAPTLRAARGGFRSLLPPAQVQQLYSKMPPFLEAALLPFQREGVLFGLARGGRCLIADEMGVGKTVQAIALASCYQDEWPVLIIVPASLRLVWAEELEKWLPHLRPSSIHVIEGKEDRVAQGALPLVTITSYEMMQRLTCDACKGRVAPQSTMCAGQRAPCKDLQNCMASQRWKVVIVDESHTLRTSNKPPDALHTEAVVSAAKLARRAILLTGTPSLSRPFDLFRQVDAIVPGLLGPNRIAFASAYCNRREVPLPGFHGPGERRTRWDVSGLSRGGELHDMLKAEVMLRRLKKDVLSQLPPKRRQVIRLPKPPAAEWPKLPQGTKRHADDSEGSASSGEEDEYSEEEGDEEGEEGGSRRQRQAKPMSAAHRTGLAKASAVIDWLMTALGVRSSSGGSSSGAGRSGRGGRKAAGAGAAQPLDDDDAADSTHTGGGSTADAAPKFLVFAHHKTVMNRLAAALEGATGYAPVCYVRIDGGTDSEDRRIAVRRFRADAAVRVALLSVTAAGVGLDFSSASVVVFAELPDEVAHVRQAEDRAHRQGQRQPVNVYFLCAKGTTDDRRWQHLNRSLARVAAVHDGALAPPVAAAAGAGAAAAAAGARPADGSGGGAGGDQDCTGQGGGEPGQHGAAVAAQAGLLVDCVHDAEEGGITPAAARAGLPAGMEAAAPGSGGPASDSRHGTQTGESPLPALPGAALAAALAAAAGTAAGTALGSPLQVASPGAGSPGAAAVGVPAGIGSPATGGTAHQEEQQRQKQEDTEPVPFGSPSAPPAALPASAHMDGSGGVAAMHGTAGDGGTQEQQRQAEQPAGSTAAAPAAAASSPASSSDVISVPSADSPLSDCLKGAGMRPSGKALDLLEPPAQAEPVEVWFEVSGNTNRVHLHAAPDGSAPLRLSLPMEALLAGTDSPPLEELLAAVAAGAPPAGQQQQAQQQQQVVQQQHVKQHQQPAQQVVLRQPAGPLAQAAGVSAVASLAEQQQKQQQQQAAGLGTAWGEQQEQQQDAAAGDQQQTVSEAASRHQPHQQPVQGQQGLEQQQQQQQFAPSQPRPAVVGSIGVLALDSHVSAAKLAAMLAEARDFAAEWRELRGLHQSRLQGKVLRVPLQEAVEEVDRAAAAAGLLGTSTSRFVDAQRSDLALPPGAEWRTVRVHFKRYARESQYQQPFMPDGSRLCINCAKPVPGAAAAQPAEAVLDGMTNLFCCGECEGRFALKSNGSAYRRALFKLERGVCVACRLDCHTLVKRLQAVEKGSRGWEEQRRRIIAARAPRLLGRGYKAHLDLLVRRAVEGNAWQADHILPVYKGGGLCDVDNLRTLCVACHADVTREQTKERAAARRAEKEGRMGDIRDWLLSTQEREAAGLAGAEEEGGGGGGGEAARPVVIKRRAKLQRLFCEDSDDAEWLPAAAAQRDTSAAAPAGQAADAPAAAAAAPAAPASRRRGAAAAAVAAAAAALTAKTAAGGGGRGGGAGSDKVARRPRRGRLRPLLLETDDAELAVDLTIDADAPALDADAEPADASALQHAQPAEAQQQQQAQQQQAQGAAGGSKIVRRPCRLKPLLSDSEDAEVSVGEPAGGPPAARLHRLARSSTAGEEGGGEGQPAAAAAAAAAGSGRQPLASAAASNQRAGAKKRGRAAAGAGAGAAAKGAAAAGGGAEGSKPRKIKLERRARVAKSSMYLDDDSEG